MAERGEKAERHTENLHGISSSWKINSENGINKICTGTRIKYIWVHAKHKGQITNIYYNTAWNC